MVIFTSKYLKVADAEPQFETLNGFLVQPLDSFVKTGAYKTAEDVPTSEPLWRSRTKEDSNFGLGAKTRKLEEDELKEYAGRIKYQKKTPQDTYSMPYVHKQNIKIVDASNHEYDLNALRASITKRPAKLLRKNEKMQHSDGTKVQYYNIGLPALKGLAVNEKTGEFVVVDTCPGSGACKTFCYAMKGSYVMFKEVSMAQTQVLNFLINSPKRFSALLKAEITTAIIQNEDDDTEVAIRWHDAGDFFSPQYAELAFDVARAFPDTTFYCYTKISAIANGPKPPNFFINFSEGALPSESKKVNMTQIKHSIVVPKTLFYDLVPLLRNGSPAKGEDGQVHFKDANSWNEFVERLVAKYKIKKDTILSYNEYMTMKDSHSLGDTQKWNVIVPPGAGDNSANDPLVLGTYLLYH